MPWQNPIVRENTGGDDTWSIVSNADWVSLRDDDISSDDLYSQVVLTEIPDEIE